MKTFYRLKIIAVALVITVAGLIPAAAYGNGITQYKENIIEYNLQNSSANSIQEWIDGELTRDAGAGSEWYIIALSNYGKYEFSNYKTALNSYLAENEIGSASSRLKYALTYIAAGDKSNPYINKTLGNSIGEQGIMSLVFGLHLLNNGCKSDAYASNEIVDELLSLQLDDGGFAVAGEYGDVDVTAMVIQALAVHYGNNYAVKSSVDSALAFLSERQLESGGYSSYGVANPESAAQVIIALSSLNIDACNDERFIKNGNTVFDGINSFCLADGSFCHKEGTVSNSTATAQVFCALIAYENMKNGKSPFYIFSKNVTAPAETTIKQTAAESSLAQSTLSESTAEETTFESTIITSEKSETEKTESGEQEADYSLIAIIAVCVASILICAVLVAAKKRKLIAVVIIATVAAVALVIGISGNSSSEKIGSVSISINCHVIKNENKSYVPQNGIILKETEIEIENGDTVYDVFTEVCKKNGILFSSNMGYIEGINNIFETDFGDNSGWIYFVNGKSPSVGCESYKLANGDKIEWHYTRNLGEDLDVSIKKEYN